MSARTNSREVTLASFRETPAGAKEVKIENKVVFLGLHALGKKTLRVTTDRSRITFIYLESEVKEAIALIMNGITNGASDGSDVYKVDVCRLLIGWNAWETYLNQMRDMARADRPGY